MMYLLDPVLGRLDLRLPGVVGPYSVTSFTIGNADVREVVRDRPAADGRFDDSGLHGARAITVNLTVNDRLGDPVVLLDRLNAYLLASRRPRLVWSVPGSSEVRSCVVRAAPGMPVPVARRRFHQVVISWVSVGSFLESEFEESVVVPAASLAGVPVGGRSYDLSFDRTYPEAEVSGNQTVVNLGNASAHWRATIFGPAVDPVLRVGDTSIEFDRNGGLTLAAGQSVVLDTEARTILFGSDPNGTRADRVNFLEWQWADIRLSPGPTVFRYLLDLAEPGAAAHVSWRSAWL